MQTRRKSLNLVRMRSQSSHLASRTNKSPQADLGVVAPKRAHPSPPATVIEGDEQPAKRAKRSHTSSQSPPPALMCPPQTTTIRVKDERPKPAADLSPPPSPVVEGSSNSKVDTEGINDDIVVATIQQLEKTGNRPHLVRELANILATKLHAVEKYEHPINTARLGRVANLLNRSANPCALISSRLTAYLQRSWPAISPCPLAKDIAPVHPRRLYFYLTTTPHQPIPEVAEPVPKANRIISPSLSSAADEEDRFLRQRQALSPSPEVDLSSPDLEEDHGDAPPTPGGSYSGRNSMARDRSTSYTHPRRAASPQLENEERDFKQTANALYEQAKARRSSQESQDVNMEQDASSGADQDSHSVTMSIEGEETEESLAQKNSEAAAVLFGASKMLAAHHMEFSSPVLGPQNGLRVDTDGGAEADYPNRSEQPGKDEGHYISLPEAAFAWDQLQSPEDIELEELDDMLDAY